MKALLLAAGEGKRLRPLTWFTAKPMIKVGGVPVLRYLVNYLKEYGIKEIFVNLHHKPMSVFKYFGEELTYLYEKSLLKEEGTLQCFRSHFKDDYLVVMNGDTLTNVNLDKMFKYSSGKNIRLMDGDIYAGTRILPPDYYYGQKEILYQDADLQWIDVGTFKGLLKARREYEKFSSLREL